MPKHKKRKWNINPHLTLLSADSNGPLFARSNQSLHDARQIVSVLSPSNHFIWSHNRILHFKVFYYWRTLSSEIKNIFNFMCKLSFLSHFIGFTNDYQMALKCHYVGKNNKIPATIVIWNIYWEKKAFKLWSVQTKL